MSASTILRPVLGKARATRGGYARRNAFSRYWPFWYTALAALLLVYGLGFALSGGDPRPFLSVPIILVCLIFWVMPSLATPPAIWINRLLYGLILSQLFWPPYLAVVLPGLPWISATRIFGLPLLLVLMACAFGSAEFRAQMAKILAADPVIPRLMLIFAVIATLSVGLSHDVASSMNRLGVAFMAWFAPFYAACYYFSQPGKAKRLVNALTSAVFVAVLIGLYEVRFSQLPWKDHVPWFLNVGDDYAVLLNGQSRAASGLYRVQAQFFGSIGLGEFFGMALPFVMYKLMETKRNIVRVAIVLMLPPMFLVVVRTDSRLAFICFASTLILSILLGAINHLRMKRASLIAQAIILAYPAFLAAFIALSLFWRRLSNMVWGGGAQQASTESREVMFHTGVPMIIHAPWGHGIGQAAVTLGYVQPGSGLLTIDSYYLSVGLEFGVVGFVVFYGMFVWAIIRSGMVSFETRDPEILCLAPAAIALVNFMISKSIFSQQENHPLAFTLLGLVVALLYRYQQGKVDGATPQGASVRPRPRFRRAAA